MTSNKAFMEKIPHSPCEEGVDSDPFQDDNRDVENRTFEALGIDLNGGGFAGAMGGSTGYLLSPTGIPREASDDIAGDDSLSLASNRSFRGLQDSQSNCPSCEKHYEDISQIKNMVRSLSGNHISQDAFCKIIEQKEDLKQGSGGCLVSKYQWKKSGVVIAGKRMDKGLYPTYKKELNIISKVASSECAHKNIALYITHHEEENCVILFTELCDFSLEEYIMNEVKLENECEPPTALDILKQAVQGIKHLHGHDVVHKDVKPSNFLLKKRCESCKKSLYVLKVIDFGLSAKLDSDRSTLLTQNVSGTRCYMAPEYYTSPICLSKATDVFALGLVFYYVLTGGKHPFGTKESRIVFNIDEGTEPNFTDLTHTLFEWCFQYLCNCKNGDWQPRCSDMRSQLAEEKCVLAMDLISRMIRGNPKMRPTIEEVEIHPFFWNAATKEKFYQVANDVVQKRRADAKFLKRLNKGIPEENGERRMSIKDLQLPAEPKYPQKKCGGEYVTQDYKDIKEYLLFLRNMLVHCRPDLTNPKDLMEIRKELQDYLTADTKIRLPKLTFPYPNLLLHLLTMLVGEKEFTDAFKEDAKIDLTLMKTMVQE